MKNNTKVAIVMGSESDMPVMEFCSKHLNFFNIENEVFILSAHRTPDETSNFSKNAEKNGYAVIIAAAGMAAHLAGVITAHTTLPVIGVPLSTSDLNGMDALLSMVQMPSGVPVATVSIGKAGAINSAVYAAEILALNDAEIREKLLEFKRNKCKLPE